MIPETETGQFLILLTLPISARNKRAETYQYQEPTRFRSIVSLPRIGSRCFVLRSPCCTSKMGFSPQPMPGQVIVINIGVTV
jgi:hypothetical protein